MEGHRQHGGAHATRGLGVPEEEQPLIIKQRVEGRHQPALEPLEQLGDRRLGELLRLGLGLGLALGFGFGLGIGLGLALGFGLGFGLGLGSGIGIGLVLGLGLGLGLALALRVG